MKNIIAISGSLRTGSSNHAILKYLGSLANENVNFVIYEGVGALPHFDPGLDNEHPPEQVSAFREVLAEADGVIICSPEYAFGVPGSLKNALDWTVGGGSLEGKPLLLITASTGGEHAHAALKIILQKALGAVLSDATSLLIPYVRTKMDATGSITDAATKENLSSCFRHLLTLFP